MRITVQANHPVHSQLARAQRFWPVKEPKEVEVLDQDDDPPPVKAKVKNSTTGEMVTVERPDPDRIGRKTLAILRNDRRLSIIQLDSVTSAAADASINAAREEVGRLSGELVEVKAKLAAAEKTAEEAVKAKENAEGEASKLREELAKVQASKGAEGEHGKTEVDAGGKKKEETKGGGGGRRQ